MSRALRIGLKIACGLAALLLLLAAAGLLALRSDWFRENVRRRIVAELERITGGTATLGGYAVNWRLFTVEFRDLTLRGKEPRAAPPLFEAKSIEVGLKIVSLWKEQVDLQSIVVREPRVIRQDRLGGRLLR